MGPSLNCFCPAPLVEIEKCARDCFPLLARTHRYFTRDRTVFEVVKTGGNPRLIELEAAAFRSQLESHFWLGTRKTLPDGRVITVPNRCSVDSAVALLKTDPTFDLLPTIKIVTASAVFTEIDGEIQVLKKGYHPIFGGVLITRDRNITEVPVEEARNAILGLLVDFKFVSEADRSRAIAGFISPALRLGKLLPFDFPVDLSEANESQCGKTYRHKVICSLYGEEPCVVNKNEDGGGLGSLDERLSEGLVSGKPFLLFENVRGAFRSQLMESAIRGIGSVQARRAYGRAVQVETDMISWLLSSNKAETTPDLANRSIITLIAKQSEGYKFKIFPEGDLLKHVQVKSDYYLSCILSVLRYWHKKGKPRTNDCRHDFTEWCQTIDWIVQNVFACEPLLDGHRSEQYRISNPDLNWLRQVAIRVDKTNCLETAFKPAEIMDICEANGVDIPGCRETTDEKQRSMVVGKILKRLFAQIEPNSDDSEARVLEVGGYRITRKKGLDYNLERQENFIVHYHTFVRKISGQKT